MSDTPPVLGIAEGNLLTVAEQVIATLREHDDNVTIEQIANLLAQVTFVVQQLQRVQGVLAAHMAGQGYTLTYVNPPSTPAAGAM